jgi:hypothetical protein
VEKNTTVVFPVPVDIFAGLQKIVDSQAKLAESKSEPKA